MKTTLKPNATHLALALVLIGLRPAFAAESASDVRPETRKSLSK